MAEFHVRSDNVDVEQIMQQIRARIREKRGVDYTEEQVRELATVKLEKFLDPRNLRSDLLDQFRKGRPATAVEPQPIEPPYTFGDEDIYATHRGALRFVRRLLNPLLKLFFNPNPLIYVLHKQAEFNVDLLKREQRRRIEFERSRAEWNALYYEVLHNLVLETTRTGIEVKNMKMRLEALASRLDFAERRVRALEGVVQYRPEAQRPRDRDRDRDRDRRPAGEAEAAGTAPAAPAGEAGPSEATPGGGDTSGRRRRRRRRGRRGTGDAPGRASGAAAAPSDGDTGTAGASAEHDAAGAADAGPAGPDTGESEPDNDVQ